MHVRVVQWLRVSRELPLEKDSRSCCAATMQRGALLRDCFAVISN
jgi:hypothetical protein